MKKHKHSIQPDQKEKLAVTISSFLERNFKEIVVAYLHGSFATSLFFSDIDLGIITQNDLEKTLNFEFDLENRLEKIVKYSVDVRVLNRAPLTFCQKVIRQKNVILDRDPNLRADFEGRILKQYFDVAYFHRQYLKEVANAPV